MRLTETALLPPRPSPDAAGPFLFGVPPSRIEQSPDTLAVSNQKSKIKNQNSPTPAFILGVPTPTPSRPFAFKPRRRRVIFLLARLLFCALPVHAAEPSTSETEDAPSAYDYAQADWLRQKAREAQEQYRLRVPIPDAVRVSPVALSPAPQPLALPGAAPSQPLLLGALLGAVGLLVVRTLASRTPDSVLSPVFAAATASRELAEERAFAEFLVSFKTGPPPASRPPPAPDLSPVPHAPPESAKTPPETDAAPLEAFFTHAPEHLLGLQKLLPEITSETDQALRQEKLRRLNGQLRTLKGMAGLPELFPAWQLASALEWLLKQLADQADKVTPSTLRTVAAGLQMLDPLCRPGLDLDLCLNPPIRFLSVDDDAISRHAVSFALKKAFSQPDVAANGEAALALASQIVYDVIFLDVQMPGMDGFELCSKIHETQLNRATPVVFVTCHSDFDAHAKSALCGGTDLLGKPFLTFEITVKALTLALRARLLPCGESSAPANTPLPASVASPCLVALT